MRFLCVKAGILLPIFAFDNLSIVSPCGVTVQNACWHSAHAAVLGVALLCAACCLSHGHFAPGRCGGRCASGVALPVLPATWACAARDACGAAGQAPPHGAQQWGDAVPHRHGNPVGRRGAHSPEKPDMTPTEMPG